MNNTQAKYIDNKDLKKCLKIDYEYLISFEQDAALSNLILRVCLQTRTAFCVSNIRSVQFTKADLFNN